MPGSGKRRNTKPSYENPPGLWTDTLGTVETWRAQCASSRHGAAMSNLLHVCLYNTDPGASEELGNVIRSLNFVRLLAEVSTAEELAQILHSSTINLIFFHLDPQANPVVEVIDEVASRHPETAMIALSPLPAAASA